MFNKILINFQDCGESGPLLIVTKGSNENGTQGCR